MSLDYSQILHTGRSLGREKLEGVEGLLGLHGMLDLIDDLHRPAL